MSTRSAGIQEVLTAHFDYSTANMYTSIPGIVVSVVDMGNLLVNVKPTVNVRSEDGIVISERPPILNVPLVMPLSKQGGLSFPVREGDLVYLVFSMRGLDAWKVSNGYPTTPLDMRKFDIRDCVAMPCVYPARESINDPAKRSLSHNPDDVVLVHNVGSGNEVEIRLKAGGGVEINAPGQEVIVNSESAKVNTESVEVNTTDYTINATNYSVNTTNYSLVATGENVSQGTFNFEGSFVLNGVAVENHDHGGVVRGGSRTDPFGG